jgi:hypothetical protein
VDRIGDVHNLPGEDRPDADPKLRRPWLLLHTPGADTPHWAFAYGTTRSTEAALLAEKLSLSWTRTSGKREESDFYPARLRTPVREDAGIVVGTARARHPEIRHAFRAALGIGASGGWSGDLAEAGRGRIVRLSHSAQQLNDGARYAVIVTPNRYALQRRFQQLIPIYDAAEVEPEHGEVVVSAPWTRALPKPIHRAILAVPSLFTGSEEHQPFVPGHIAAFTRVAVDVPTMELVEAALIAHFGLGGEPAP